MSEGSVAERVRKPVRERRRLAGRDVLNLLPSDSEVQWSTLEEKAREIHMSAATLSLHLKEFTEKGMVVRRQDNSTYPPKVFYKRVSPEVLKALKPLPARIMDELRQVPEYLKRLRPRDPELAKQTLEGLLRMVMLYQEVLLIDAFLKAAEMKSGEDVSTCLRMALDYEIGLDVEWLGELCRRNSEAAREALQRLLDQRLEEFQRLVDEAVELVDRGSALIKKPGLKLRLRRVEGEG